MPERFDLKYIGADNAEHRPVVIHRAIFGSFERFIAMLIEHYAGRVSAVACAGAGHRAADRRQACRLRATACRRRLAEAGFRVQVDERQEKIGYKIREAQLQKIPYMLVVGDREAARRRRRRAKPFRRRSGIAAARRVRGVGARGSGQERLSAVSYQLTAAGSATN